MQASSDGGSPDGIAEAMAAAPALHVAHVEKHSGRHLNPEAVPVVRSASLPSRVGAAPAFIP